MLEEEEDVKTWCLKVLKSTAINGAAAAGIIGGMMLVSAILFENYGMLSFLFK